jgi:hypothetical protein
MPQAAQVFPGDGLFSRTDGISTNERRVHASTDPDTASHLWMLSKPLPSKIRTASPALGEIPSVPEKGPVVHTSALAFLTR